MSRAPTSRRVPLATGLAYHVLEWNRGAEHTVFLVHGFLDLGWGWHATVDQSELADRFHVVAPDMRGHGDSDRVGAGGYYHFMDYLADLHDLVGQLGAARVSLVGHSMGGSIAGYYAGAYPERIHRLALMEGTGPPEQDTAPPELVKGWISSWRAVRDRVSRVYPDVAAAAEALRKHDRLLDGARALWLAERGTRAHDGGRVFKHDPLHLTRGPYPYRVEVAQSFWRRVTAPVLLVEGAESPMRHTDAERERRDACFANARRVTLPGAGHMMQRHVPADLGRLLCEFLSQ